METPVIIKVISIIIGIAGGYIIGYLHGSDYDR
jgi:xanthine/uracil permease